MVNTMMTLLDERFRELFDGYRSVKDEFERAECSYYFRVDPKLKRQIDAVVRVKHSPVDSKKRTWQEQDLIVLSCGQNGYKPYYAFLNVPTTFLKLNDALPQRRCQIVIFRRVMN